MIVFFYNFKVMKPSLTVFYKEIISSPYSKGSNSLEFNPILQKFSEMICEIILSKMVSRMSLIFRRSHFINNFVVKNNFFWNREISRPIYFKNISAHHFEYLTITNKLEGSFFKKILFIDPELFLRFQSHSLARHFLHKKLIEYFFQIFNFTHALNNYF